MKFTKYGWPASISKCGKPAFTMYNTNARKRKPFIRKIMTHSTFSLIFG